MLFYIYSFAQITIIISVFHDLKYFVTLAFCFGHAQISAWLILQFFSTQRRILDFILQGCCITNTTSIFFYNTPVFRYWLFLYYLATQYI